MLKGPLISALLDEMENPLKARTSSNPAAWERTHNHGPRLDRTNTEKAALSHIFAGVASNATSVVFLANKPSAIDKRKKLGARNAEEQAKICDTF